MLPPSRLPVGVVIAAGEEVNRPVMVHGADHPVEIHRAVEELPGNVALEPADITWLPVGHFTYTKYSSRLNVNSPSVA